MHEVVRELRSARLMRIVTSQTVGLVEWLIVVGLLKVRARRIVTIEAKRRSCLGEVIIELPVPHLTGLMRDVTSATTHIERRMSATALRDVDADLVTAEAEVRVFIVAFGWF